MTDVEPMTLEEFKNITAIMEAGDRRRIVIALERLKRLERLIRCNALEDHYFWAHERRGLAIRPVPPPKREVPRDYQFEWKVIQSRPTWWDDVSGPYPTVYEALEAAGALENEDG